MRYREGNRGFQIKYNSVKKDVLKMITNCLQNAYKMFEYEDMFLYSTVVIIGM